MESQAPLLSYFDSLTDPRVERSKLHSLSEIIFIAIAGTLAGAEGWRELEAFAHAKRDWLARYLTLPHGIPSDDTFRRVISRLDPVAFECCFREWIEAALGSSKGQLVSLDGKTLRGSYDHLEGKAPLHLVSAWAAGNRMVLAQEAVTDHGNEITAMPKLLSILELQGCIVTIDAMGTQRSIAEQIVESGGDYVLSLKSNHPTLYEDVRTFFEEASAQGFVGIAHDQIKQTDGGHGRIEVRHLWCTQDIAWLRHQDRWAGLQSLIRVESRRLVGDQESVDCRYFISSLPADAAALLGAIRGHWGIENQLHWVLDMSFGEDGSRVRKGYGPENLGLLRRIALNLLRKEQSRGSLKGKRKRAGWDNNYLAKVLEL
jgi:predicted transposase YbfD/YdcC